MLQDFAKKSIFILILLASVGCAVNTPQATSTPLPQWLTPSGKDDILPSPLYFLADDKAGQCPFSQIIKLERDGLTRSEITSSCLYNGVQSFDYSLANGRFAVVAQHALWSYDGSNFKHIATGLPNPESTGSSYDIGNPVWSPDGKQIAYVDGGIRIVNISTGDKQDIIENSCNDGNGENRIFEPYTACFYGSIYRNPKWSPDGRALLLDYQDADIGYKVLYNLEDNSMHQFTGNIWLPEGNIAWSNKDNSYLIYEGKKPYPCCDYVEPEYYLVRIRRKDLELKDNSFGCKDRIKLLGISETTECWKLPTSYWFETQDDRILFLLYEPKGTPNTNGSGYALVEGQYTSNGFKAQILHHNALPPLGIWNIVWHESGKYIAMLFGDQHDPTNITWHILVMNIQTGEIYSLAEESGTYVERLGTFSHVPSLVWGK